jgi:hypothetical protein
MILLGGANFDAATRWKYISTATSSANYALSPKEDRLPSFLQRKMRFIMTRSF